MNFIRRSIVVTFIVATALRCLASDVLAAVPKTMSYQGYLTDAVGVPISGSRSMVFGLYDASSGGTALWTETQPTVALANGIYQVTLGSVTPLNLPFDQPYYLGVAVGTDPELTPRQLLTSVGTSLRAAVADSVAAGSITTAALAPAAQADFDNRYAPASFSQASAGQIATLRWDLAKPGATFAVGSYPRAPAYDGTNVWVPNYGGNTVSKIRASDGYNQGFFTVGSGPAAVAFDGTYVWVTNYLSGKVSKLLAENGGYIGEYTVGTNPWGICFDGTNIWVANSGNKTVTKLRASDGGFLSATSVGATPAGVAFDGANIWVANYGDNTVTKIRASDGVSLGTYPVGTYPMGIVFDGSSIWVANYGSNNVTKLNPATGAVIGTYSSGGTYPRFMAFDGTSIWVVNYGSNLATRLRLIDGSLIGSYTVGTSPWGAVYDGSSIWVTNYYGNTVTRVAVGTETTYAAGAAGVMDSAVTSSKLANSSVTSSKLNIDADFRLNDKNILLRSDTDINHGLGWHGIGKAFAGITTLDGPVLYGYGKGALGTTGGGQQIALTWDSARNVSAAGNLSVAGGLTLTGGMDLGGHLYLGSTANITLSERDLYVGSDTNHGLGWYGVGKTFNSVNVDGPVLYGWSGGALGTTNPAQKLVLTWNKDSQVGILGTLRTNDNDIYLRANGGDTAHGLGWYAYGTKNFKSTTFSDGPVLYGYGSGGLGTSYGGGNIALKWEYNGNVQVAGTLSKGGGSFRIDHPLDPKNKYLQHSFVESPDMMNVYNGNALLDQNGEALIELPMWFETLNRDFRYQLTCIGGFAPVYIAEEIAGNRFKIAGGRPGLKVSWQVTGIRQDPYAENHRIQVEVDKPAAELGSCLHEEACR